MKSDLPTVDPEDHGATIFASDRAVFYTLLGLGIAGVVIACWAQSLLAAGAGGWFLRSALSMRRPDEHPMTPAMKLIVNELNDHL